MNAIQKASEILGSQTALAKYLGVTIGAVSQWGSGHRPIPAERCPSIERATNGAVTCEELRPDVDWAVLRDQPTAAPALTPEPALASFEMSEEGRGAESIGQARE